MQVEIPENLLDSRNQPIWNELTYTLEFKRHEGRHCYSNIFYDTADFFIPMEDCTKEVFTHELLHVLLYQEKIRITEYIVHRFKTQALLSWSLSGNLFSRVGHYLEDYKILSIYLMAGFQRELFTEDYHLPRCTAVNMETIRAGLSKAVPSIYSVDLFIGKFFAMKASPNNKINYQNFYEQLQWINPSLYNILNTFWERWVEFDIYNYKQDHREYREFTDALVFQLGEWTVSTIHARQGEQAKKEFKNTG